MRTGKASLQLAPVNGQGWLGHFAGFRLAIIGSGTGLFAGHFFESPINFHSLSWVSGMSIGIVVSCCVELSISIGIQ